MRTLLSALSELVLPSACAACGGERASGALCQACRARLPRIPVLACAGCQARSPLPGQARCGACSGRASPLDACLAAAHLEGEVLAFVHRFKYPRGGLSGLDPAPPGVLAELIREAARRAPGPPPGLVVAVPLHPRRLRQRGFNPAERLARQAARAARAPCDPLALERLRDTVSQTGLDRRARRRNVAGAFRVRRRRRIPSCVWLVDDVVTTGATLEAAARALARAGAQRVIGLCAARTPAGR